MINTTPAMAAPTNSSRIDEVVARDLVGKDDQDASHGKQQDEAGNDRERRQTAGARLLRRKFGGKDRSINHGCAES